MITPEAYRARARRTHARQAVRRAGLPLFLKYVDRARALLDENADIKDRMDVVIDALRIEYRRAS